MNAFRPSILAISGIIFVLSSCVSAENWPNWRGPNSNGVSGETNVPTKWDRETNVKWRIDLPERGNSTPIVWGDKIFVTQAIEAEDRRTLMCLNREDGSLLWQSGVTYTKKEPTHKANPYCSASPVTDGERVIAWYGPAGVSAYDFEVRNSGTPISVISTTCGDMGPLRSSIRIWSSSILVRATASSWWPSTKRPGKKSGGSCLNTIKTTRGMTNPRNFTGPGTHRK